MIGTIIKIQQEIDLLNASTMNEIDLYKFACNVKRIVDEVGIENDKENGKEVIK